jgi:uncharacterized phage-associated protein
MKALTDILKPMGSTMRVDFDKVAAYLADNTERLYVTKLLKLFYYIDFISYNKRGAPVTNDIYFKLPFGPVPTAVKSDIDILASTMMGEDAKSQLAKYIELHVDDDKNGRIVRAKQKDNDLRTLSGFETEVITTVAAKFKAMRAKQLSNQTHREAPWLMTNENSVIDYHLSEKLDVEKILA